MAKVKLNPVLEQVRGQVGDLVFKRYGEGVVMGRRPDRSGVQATEAQLEHQERFRHAVLYGKLVMADSAKRALYEDASKASGKPLFSLTVADFFNAPAVDEVDLSGYTGAAGDPIVVLAHDDFKVAEVRVSVNDANGQAIESGKAVETPAKSGRWVYTATQAVAAGSNVRIAVAASDQPGGAGQASAEKTL